MYRDSIPAGATGHYATRGDTPLARTGPPTWAVLVRLEPRLADLACDVRQRRPRKGRTDWDGYERWKGRLASLVGWHSRSRHELLHTTDAYDVAHRVLMDLWEGRP